MTRVTIFGGHKDGEEFSVPEPLPQEYHEPVRVEAVWCMESDTPEPLALETVCYRLEWMAIWSIDEQGVEIVGKWPVYMHPDVNAKALNG